MRAGPPVASRRVSCRSGPERQAVRSTRRYTDRRQIPLAASGAGRRRGWASLRRNWHHRLDRGAPTLPVILHGVRCFRKDELAGRLGPPTPKRRPPSRPSTALGTPWAVVEGRKAPAARRSLQPEVGRASTKLEERSRAYNVVLSFTLKKGPVRRAFSRISSQTANGWLTSGSQVVL